MVHRTSVSKSEVSLNFYRTFLSHCETPVYVLESLLSEFFKSFDRFAMPDTKSAYYE